MGACAAASLALLLARRALGAGRAGWSAAGFGLLALRLPLLRALEVRRPAPELPGLLASFWLLPWRDWATS